MEWLHTFSSQPNPSGHWVFLSLILSTGLGCWLVLSLALALLVLEWRTGTGTAEVEIVFPHLWLTVFGCNVDKMEVSSSSTESRFALKLSSGAPSERGPLGTPLYLRASPLCCGGLIRLKPISPVLLGPQGFGWPTCSSAWAVVPASSLPYQPPVSCHPYVFLLTSKRRTGSLGVLCLRLQYQLPASPCRTLPGHLRKTTCEELLC